MTREDREWWRRELNGPSGTRFQGEMMVVFPNWRLHMAMCLLLGLACSILVGAIAGASLVTAVGYPLDLYGVRVQGALLAGLFIGYSTSAGAAVMCLWVKDMVREYKRGLQMAGTALPEG